MPDNDKRHDEFVREWMGKSKVAGDNYWRKANGWSGAGDYTPADEGMEKEIRYNE